MAAGTDFPSSGILSCGRILPVTLSPSAHVVYSDSGCDSCEWWKEYPHHRSYLCLRHSCRRPDRRFLPRPAGAIAASGSIYVGRIPSLRAVQLGRAGRSFRLPVRIDRDRSRDQPPHLGRWGRSDCAGDGQPQRCPGCPGHCGVSHRVNRHLYCARLEEQVLDSPAPAV